ncbi:MAG TPA: Ig-like domain-containing protein, partial [Gemmatimonadaceae bacterium]
MRTPRMLLLGFAVITACSEANKSSVTYTNNGPIETPVAVASVVVSLSASSVQIGGSVQATAVLKDASGSTLTGPTVSWSSSNAAVATVNSTGRVTALGPGSASIIATSEGVTGSADVGVIVSPPAPVASVSVSLGSSSLNVGQTTQATAVLKDGSGNVLTGRTIGWSSLNTAVATVTSAGVVTAVSAGSATIVATSEGVSGQATVGIVAAGPASVASVTVSLTGSLGVGQTTQATAVLKDASGNVLTGRAISWSSSNTAVATVNGSGVVTAVSIGSSNIVATSEGVTGQATVAVVAVPPPPVASVSVSLGSGSLTIGQTTQATAVLKDANGNVLSGRTITWTSSNTAVATVNSTGVVTATGAGSANIVATSEGVTGQASLTVTLAPVASVSVALGAGSLAVGQTTQATAVLKDAIGNVLTGRTISWSSSNMAVATVNNTGVVTAVGTGSASIVATSEGVTGQASLTVTVVPVASVSVSLASGSLTVGLTTQATAVLKDTGGNVLTGRTVTWASSNTAVATVNSTGVVTAMGAGSANIVATSGGVSGQASLTVTLVTVASVSVSLGSGSLTVGQTTQATAVLKDATGNVLTGRTITWSSSNSAVATVNSSGLVTAVGAGSANIVATSGGITGQASLSVTLAAVATVSVSLGTSNLIVGQTTQATAVLKDASGNVLTGRTITWASTNTVVATVSATGSVTAVATGNAGVTATA